MASLLLNLNLHLQKLLSLRISFDLRLQPHTAMTNDRLQNFLILLFAGIACFFGYLLFSGRLNGQPDKPDLPTGLMQTETEFRDKLTELNMRKNEVINGVERLEASKKETIDFLREKGIGSGDAYLKSDDRDVKLAVLSLEKYVKQIQKTKENVANYDDAIARIRSMLDQFKRDRIVDSVALTDDQKFELEKIIVDLNERLAVETDVLKDEELKAILDAEMVDD